MKKIITLLLLFISILGYSQVNQILTDDNGKVVLTSDGTKLLTTEQDPNNFEYTPNPEWIPVNGVADGEIWILAFDGGSSNLFTITCTTSSGEWQMDIYGGADGKTLLKTYDTASNVAISHTLITGTGKYSYYNGYYTYKIVIKPKTIEDTIGEISFFNDTNAVGTRIFPANFFHVGKMVRYQMKGDFSSVGNPTNTINITLGGVSFVSNSATLGATHTNDYCEIIFDFVCIKTGVNGEFVGGGRTILTGTGISRPFIMTTPVVINTTIANTFDCTYTWGTANVANILKCVIGTLQIFD